MKQPEQKTTRLFVALPIPDIIKKQIGALPHEGLDNAHWTHPDDLHITLRFLGNVQQVDIQAMEERFRRIRRSSFSVEARGLGSFMLKKQNILWARIISTRKITALAANINEIMGPLGFEMPNKPYTPHITIARINKDIRLENYIKKNESTISCR